MGGAWVFLDAPVPSRAWDVDPLLLTLFFGAVATAVLALYRAHAVEPPPRKSRIAPATPLTRVVLFDFDGVLTTQEVHGPMSKSARARAFGGSERLRQMQGILEELSQHARLGIVSRNFVAIIQQALGQPPELSQFFDPDLIFGYEDCPDEVPKSRIVEGALQEADLHRQELLFVDDSFLNTSDVSQHCHVETLHVRTSGMASWDWEYILSWAKAKKSTDDM
mmetsp:Transcript_71650/g.167789  ORF Transcript_71650/g.167789 Transcript_71650/m.167789 type:complete len:222 (+) Transcript_71650:49-714(+)